jgi:hypothetical protein
VALKQKRDLPTLANSKEFLLSSSGSRKRKSAAATAATSAVTNSAKSASSASVKSSSGLGAKRGRPAAGKKNCTPLVEKKNSMPLVEKKNPKLLVESSFENRWELVRVGHRYLTIPRQPSLSIKTYSKRRRLKSQQQEKPVLLPGPDAAPINHSTSALGTVVWCGFYNIFIFFRPLFGGPQFASVFLNQNPKRSFPPPSPILCPGNELTGLAES